MTLTGEKTVPLQKQKPNFAVVASIPRENLTPAALLQTCDFFCVTLSPMQKSFGETKGQSQTTWDYKLGNLHQPFNRYVDFEDCGLKLEVCNGICTLTSYKCGLCNYIPSQTSTP